MFPDAPIRSQVLPASSGQKTLRWTSILALVAGLSVSTQAAFGVTTSLLPRVPDSRLDSALSRTWRGLVKTNIDPWTDGMVHRPYSEIPGDAVSEGQAYGMILALYAGDQKNFNRIWDAAETHLWNENTGFYDWRWNQGEVIGGGMATDADQDIALMLLFADSLVKKGMWTAHQSPKKVGYKARALRLLETLWGSAVTGNYNLAPGAGWGGDGFVNPGYYSPASYKIFAMVDPDHDWNAVVDQCYAVLGRNPGAGLGMAPDWMVPDGSFFDGSLGYNAYRQGRAMYKDAIRVHWRLSMDWLWFGDLRAKRLLDSAAAFIKTPDRANFYDLDGALIPVTDTFRLGSDELRSRREYSELTLGMWACAAFSSFGPEAMGPWVDSMLAFLPEGAQSWGRPTDMDLPDRTGSTPNEQYFEQFLAWFGTATLAGRFSNVFDDLDDPDPSLPLAWITPPSANPVDLDLQEAPLTVRAKLNKAASWTVSIESYPAGKSWSTSGRSAEIQASWTGMDVDGKPFPQGWCQVKTSVRGLPMQWSWVWLGHHRDIRLDDNWLIVDDFSASSLAPNVGDWRSFNNSSGGGTAKVGPLAPSGTGDSRNLTYTYDLGENGYQYCGLEWTSSGWGGFASTTKVRFSAKADHPTVVDLYLMQSDIGDDNYFHVLDTLTTSWKTFEHTFSTFTGRLANRDGSPDLSKSSALRWHVQADKCLKSDQCVTGEISIDNVHLAGDMAQMIQAPAPRLAMPADPPVIGIGDRAAPRVASLRTVRMSGGTVVLQGPAGIGVQWTDVSGRMLGESRADASGRITWNYGSGRRGLVLALPSDAGHPLMVMLR